MYPHNPSYTTHARSRTHSTPDLPTVYNPCKSSVAAYQCFSFINLKMANEKGPKHVVVLYAINYTYLYHHIVVPDRYTHSNLVYYKHNGDDEPYDYNIVNFPLT